VDIYDHKLQECLGSKSLQEHLDSKFQTKNPKTEKIRKIKLQIRLIHCGVWSKYACFVITEPKTLFFGHHDIVEGLSDRVTVTSGEATGGAGGAGAPSTSDAPMEPPRPP
jgi:hypothetical protein